jgi:hypothetical protein
VRNVRRQDRSPATRPFLDHQLLGLEKNVHNRFRICGSNDRWFADQKNATAVFYGYGL